MKSLCLFLALGFGLYACSPSSKEKTESNATESSSLSTDSQGTVPEGFVAYTFRQKGSVETFFVKLNGETLLLEDIMFQGANDPAPIKLRILSEDEESLRLSVERSDNQEKMTISKDWMMAGVRYLNAEESITYSPEFLCYAPDGQVLATSAGPIFAPFAYKADAQSKLQEVELLGDGMSQTNTDGSSSFQVKLPGKEGIYKITPQPYEEGNPITKLLLEDAQGKQTLFVEKK
jgi:hypothetical protein